MQTRHLLAVDAGLRCGFALFGPDGRLCWYRSRHLADRRRWRRYAERVLAECPPTTWVVLEGGGDLADLWRQACDLRQLPYQQIAAETWRRDLFPPRHWRTGSEAKRQADKLARQVIDWSAAKRPTSLRHDAAEAILIGFWWLLANRWLADPGPVGPLPTPKGAA